MYVMTWDHVSTPLYGKDVISWSMSLTLHGKDVISWPMSLTPVYGKDVISWSMSFPLVVCAMYRYDNISPY